MKIKLNELGEIVTGNTPSKQVPEYWNSKDICFIKPDIINETGINEITNTSEYISESARGKARIVGSNAILVTCIGSIGKIGITGDNEYAFNQQINAIVPRKEVYPKYLAYSLLYSKTELLSLANAPVVPIINKKQFGEFEINHTKDYHRQVEIASILDSIQHILGLYRQQLQALDDLVKARFVEMFGDPVSNPMGWKIKRFDEICENLDYLRRPITASEREAGPYPYYGASGIVDYVADYIFDEDILLISEDGANLLMRSTPIAFSVSGKVWVNNHAHVVRFDDMGLQKYIEVLFSLIDISDQITGSAQPKLNQANLNAMIFPIPHKDRTDYFLSLLNQIDRSKVAIHKALDKTQMLFDSLMQEYFQGEDEK